MRAGVTSLLVCVGVSVGPSVANGSVAHAGNLSARVESSSRTPSQFSVDFTGNVPDRNQRAVGYLLSHGGYSVPLSVRRAGTLEVVWTALGAKGPITLATGKGVYTGPGGDRFQLRLTRNGRAALERMSKLTLRIAGWYGRSVLHRSRLCLYEVDENSAHSLVFTDSCGP